MEQAKDLLDQYPFLTLLKYGGVEYIGIIQNSDETITTIYDFAVVKMPDQKTKFLELAEVWWWESNRKIPINLFLKQDWLQFRFTVKTFVSKDVQVLYGHKVNLKEIAERRSKKRSITLIRKM